MGQESFPPSLVVDLVRTSSMPVDCLLFVCVLLNDRRKCGQHEIHEEEERLNGLSELSVSTHSFLFIFFEFSFFSRKSSFTGPSFVKLT